MENPLELLLPIAMENCPGGDNVQLTEPEIFEYDPCGHS